MQKAENEKRRGTFETLFRVQELLRRSGLRPLLPDEEVRASEHYQRELLAGLDRRESTVKMYRSLADNLEVNHLPEGAEALVIEVGGTNRYMARVVIENGQPQVKEHVSNVLSGRIFANPEVFFTELTEGIEPILQTMTRMDGLAIVYSFPGGAEKVENGIDVNSPEDLPKGFVIPGISHDYVGKMLLQTLAKNHPEYELSDKLPIAVLNDTVAVLFADGAKIGGIVGTGFNLAMETFLGTVNSESGGFGLSFTHAFAEQIDTDPATDTNNPGKQLAEKQVAGKYLGKAFQYIAEKFAAEGLISQVPPELKRAYDTIVVDNAEKRVEKDVDAKILSQYIENTSQEGDVPALREAAMLLRDRSAQIVGLMIATAIKTFPDVFAGDEISVPIEGSLFWRMPGYKEHVQSVAERISGKRLVFPFIEEAGRKGAAAVVLGQQ